MKRFYFNRFLNLILIMVFFILTSCSTISAYAGNQRDFLSLRAGDFPKYVTSIKIDNFYINTTGSAIQWGAWTVSFEGSDPAIASWHPAIDARTGNHLPAFSITHLKCHNDVIGDVNKGCIISIGIYDKSASLYIIYNKGHLIRDINLPEEIIFQ